MLDLDDHFVLQPDVLFQEVGDETVIVLPTQACFVVLNASGAFLLPHLQQPTSLRQLADDLCTHYDIPPAQAQADILAWAHEMIEAGVCRKE